MLRDIDLSTLEAELGALSETAVLDEAAGARWAIRGATPRLTCRPSTPEDLGGALAACDRAGASVIPWGGGTQQRLGRAPRGADVVLHTGGLHRIVEYEPADLTVTVEAGLSLADLQAELAKNGQWFPVDPPVAPEATVGGVIATNVNGARRMRYGGLRDLVIGTRTAGVDGKVTRAGGRVVKNVTGYDLNKAHIGALGTLGVLAEVSLKIAPKPEAERSWFGVFPSAMAAAGALGTLLRLPVVPAALEILNHRSARTAGLSVLPGQWVLVAAAEGFLPQVERYLAEFDAAAMANGAVSLEPLSDRAAANLWQTYRAMAADLRWASESLTCRAAVPAAEVGRVCELAGELEDEPVVWSHGYGAVFWSIPASTGSRGAGSVEQIRGTAEAANGALVVENWPASLANVDVWGKPGGPAGIMEAIKRQFDPNGILNPGRFVGGI